MCLYLGGMFVCLTAFRQQPLFVERAPPPIFEVLFQLLWQPADAL